MGSTVISQAAHKIIHFQLILFVEGLNDLGGGLFHRLEVRARVAGLSP